MHLSLLLMLFGSMLNLLAYQSVAPLIALSVFFAVGMVTLKFPALNGHFERAMFVRVFCVSWFMAGIAAIYANYLNDPSQLRADAGNFYYLSTNKIFGGLGLEELMEKTEGSASVFIWRFFYDFWNFIGFEKGRYIGVLVNIVIVAFTGVIAVKTARLVYGNDTARLSRLITLFSSCGLFWMFAAIHIRDGIALAAVTLLVYFWNLFLVKPGFRSIVFLVGANTLAFTYFAFIRAEFSFVPPVMAFAGLLALSIFYKGRGLRKSIVVSSSIVGFIGLALFLPNILVDLEATLDSQGSKYLVSAAMSSSEDSLGMGLVMNQPLPIKIVLGSLLLYIFPVPFWSGFQLETVYHLFKSFNVIFFYFVIPLFILSLRRLYRVKNFRTPPMVFNVVVVLGFTIAIAGSSNETRHLGAFLVPLFIVALLPDLTIKKEKRAYKDLLFPYLLAMTIVHLLWAVLNMFR